MKRISCQHIEARTTGRVPQVQTLDTQSSAGPVTGPIKPCWWTNRTAPAVVTERVRKSEKDRQCSSYVGKRAGCERNRAQSSARTTEIRAQFSAQTTQNLLRVNDQNLVLWAIDENMGTNLQEFYKHFYIGCLKTQKQQLHFVI